jgi:nucleoside-diphosphate-sugar epimerase
MAEFKQRCWPAISYDRATNEALDLRNLHRFEGALGMLVGSYETIVIHAAGMPGRVFCERDIERAASDNVWATRMVVCACERFNAKLVYISTSEVYGYACDRGPVDEDSDLEPRNVYGRSKAEAEKLVRCFLGDRAMIVRPTMPYGPGNEVGEGRAALPTFIANALAGLPSCAHRGTARSWCYIDDTIRGIADVVEHGLGGAIYNVGRDDDLIDTFDLAQMVYRILGADRLLVRDEPPDQTITPVKDISCARLRDLGWRPRTELHEGIHRTADWLREREKAAA